MLSVSDFSNVHVARVHVVIVFGRYGNSVSNFGRVDGVRMRGGVFGVVTSELDDAERTCSLRGCFGLGPERNDDAEANMVAASLDHFAYNVCVFLSNSVGLVSAAGPKSGASFWFLLAFALCFDFAFAQ